MNKFGTLLRKFREERGLRQFQAAKAMGMHRNNLAHIETNRHAPPNCTEKVMRYVKHLHLSKEQGDQLLAAAKRFHHERIDRAFE